MGFGKSETPQDRSYEIRDHCENLEKLLLHLDLRDVTLVVQDWGGAIGGSFAYRHPDRVKRLCVMDTIVGGQAPPGTPTIRDYPWYKWVHSEAFEPILSNLGSTTISVMKHLGFENTAQVNETWIRAYATPFPTVEECKGAIKFPLCIGSQETRECMIEQAMRPGALDAVRAKPAMYVHGEADRAIPTEFAVACFKDLWPDGPVVTLPGVGHFLQEDAPETVTALIAQFIQMT
jgi:haloalkane dehalogenase